MEFKEHINAIFKGEKALSYSALSKFLKSPRHYYKYVMEKKTTPAMEEGKRFHMAMLEPEKYNKKYFILDDSEKVNGLILSGYKAPRNTKEYKEWKQKQLDLNSDKELIDLEEHEIYMRMIEALNNHSVCKDLMNGEGENEKHVKYDDDYKIQCYIDRATKYYTVDLKKVADASFHKIKWDIERNNYDLQGVIYSKANRTNKHYLIYIDKECNITVVLMNEERLKAFEVKYNFALESFTRCIEEDKWNLSYDFWQPVIVL